VDEKDQKIIELKADGKSLRDIAAEIGISHVAVKKRLDRLPQMPENDVTNGTPLPIV